MQLCRTPTPPLHVPPLRRSRPSHCFQPPPNFFEHQSAAASLLLKPRSLPGIRCISSHDHGVIQQDEREVETVASGGSDVGSYEEAVEVPVVAAEVGEQLAEQSLWKQMTEIVKFAGPAAGIWICGPLMSLIDTAVVGQGSSTELAALGPTTVLSDSISYVFMFLSIAASNMVATSLAREIRGLAWPFILIGWVAQSASLGMKNSWGPLKALAVASAINGVGDVILCLFMDYGIAGAVWATMVSQHVFSVVAAYMMIAALNGKGYNAFAVYVPSYDELVSIIGITAPAFITMISKVAFFSLLTYAATSMGTILLPLTRS